MDGTISSLTEQYLLLELERVEEAIGRAGIFTRWLDPEGRSHVKIDEELLRLAEREHAILQELRRRRPLAPRVFHAVAA